jgi:hypothetical protein
MMGNVRGIFRNPVARHALVGLAIIGGASVAISSGTVAAADLGSAIVGEQIAVTNLCGGGNGELVITATSHSSVTTQTFDGFASPFMMNTAGLAGGNYTVQASCVDKLTDTLVPSGVIDTFVLVPIENINLGNSAPGAPAQVPIHCGPADSVLIRWGIAPTNPSDPSTGVLFGQVTLASPAPAAYSLTDPAFVLGQVYTSLVYCTPAGDPVSSVPNTAIQFGFASLAPVTTIATPTTVLATATTAAPQGQLPSTGRASDGTLTLSLLLIGIGVGAIVLTRGAPRS